MYLVKTIEYSSEKIKNKLGKDIADDAIYEAILEQAKDGKMDIDDPFTYYVSSEGTDAICFTEVTNSDKVLCIPIVVPIKYFREFISRYYSLGNDYKAIAFTTSETPSIQTGFQKHKKQKLSSDVSSINNNTIEIEIDLINSRVNNLIEKIAKMAGLTHIQDVLPLTKGCVFRADFTIIERQEVYLSPEKTLVI